MVCKGKARGSRWPIWLGPTREGCVANNNRTRQRLLSSCLALQVRTHSVKLQAYTVWWYVLRREGTWKIKACARGDKHIVDNRCRCYSVDSGALLMTISMLDHVLYVSRDGGVLLRSLKPATSIVSVAIHILVATLFRPQLFSRSRY